MACSTASGTFNRDACCPQSTAIRLLGFTLVATAEWMQSKEALMDYRRMGRRDGNRTGRTASKELRRQSCSPTTR